MIIKESSNKNWILFEPEDMKERKILTDFPGFLREGLYFFSPNKQPIVQNLYKRISSKIKGGIKYTPLVKELLQTKQSLAQLPSTFTFFTKPLPHQELALRYAYTYGSLGLLLEPGLGKTKIVLDYIHLQKFSKSIIVCPKPLLSVWKEEGQKHRPELSIYIIQSTDWTKEEESVKSADVVVVNYDKSVILLEALQKLSAQFIGLDEGLIKDHTTDRTKALIKLSKTIPYRMVMSGTLVNNSPGDLFSPIRFLEPSLFGEGITRFKDRYAVLAPYNKNIISGFRDTAEIRSVLEACSIVMRKEEWLKDLPKKYFHEIYVQLPDIQRDWYTKVSNDWLLLKEHSGLKYDVEIDIALVALAKLTQIANGFLYYKENEEEKDIFGTYEKSKKKTSAPKEVHFFEEQPKVNKLLEIIEDPARLKGRRAIIWFNLSAELKILEKAFKEKGISYLVVAGGEKDISGKIHKFNTDPTIRFCICQAKTINYGVTILGHGKKDEEEEVAYEFDSRVSDEIFYSLNFSLEVFLQQQDRIHRIGQVRDCNYWLLLTNTSIEKHIAETLESKKICNQQMLIDISKTAKIIDI